MSWRIVNLTTASNTTRVSFAGRGSIYVEGTFGSGTLKVKPIAVDSNNAEVVASASLYDMDGTTIALSSCDVPSGFYELDLDGSTGADIDVYVNEQKDWVTAS